MVPDTQATQQSSVYASHCRSAIGGILSLYDANGSHEFPSNGSAKIETARGLLSLVKKWSLKFIPFTLGFQWTNNLGDSSTPLDYPPLPVSYYWTDNSVIAGPSRFSLGMLKRTDPREVVRLRRDNFAQLRRSLDDIVGLEFLWEEDALPDGMCPLGLPVCSLIKGGGGVVP